MQKKRNLSQAAFYGGIAVIYAALLYYVLLRSDNDLTFLMEAASSPEPYGVKYYLYPAWCTLFLQCLSYFGPTIAIVFVWALCIGAAWYCAPRWETPIWLVLISPPFVRALVLCHPFEALILVGMSLVLLSGGDWLAIGLGLTLLLFKPQVGAIPAIVLAAACILMKKQRKAPLFPMVMVVGATLLDWFLTGRLWIVPWLMSLSAPTSLPWNIAPAHYFGWLTVLWAPLLAWLIERHKGDPSRNLWVLCGASFLLSPYWTAYSLWPLIAMIGCWRSSSTV